MGSELLTSDPQRSIGSERWKGWISGSERRNDQNHTVEFRLRSKTVFTSPAQSLDRAQSSGLCSLSFLWQQAAGNNMMPWLRGWVLQVLRNARGFCGPHRQQPPLPDPQKIVATWEAITLGRQPVPEYFNFAHDVLDMWSQLEKVKPTMS